MIVAVTPIITTPCRIPMLKKKAKPYSEYPLWWHPQGYWAKKIRGKVHYFGARYRDWEEALKEYQAQVDDLQLGNEPTPQSLTIEQLCNLYLHSKQRAVESGEFAERSWRDYRNVAKRIVDHFGASRPGGTIVAGGLRRVSSNHRGRSLSDFPGQHRAGCSHGVSIRRNRRTDSGTNSIWYTVQ